MSFWGSLFQELSARRTRLRRALGDRGQSLFEFVVLGALVLSSLGLYLRPWMAAAAPWGFAAPFVFVAGYLLLDLSRQRDNGVNGRRHDLLALGWTLLCCAVAIATFVLALLSEPPPPPEPPAWQPPEDVEIFDLSR